MQTQMSLSEEEEDPAYCRFFAENLSGTAMQWFMDLDGGSIDSFEQLVKAFIGQFSTLVKVLASEADLWRLKQKTDEPLKAYIDKFKAVRTKIPNINHKMAIEALMDGLLLYSHFGRELHTHKVYSIDDALYRGTNFAIYEEVELAKEAILQSQRSDPQGSKNQGKKHPQRDNKTTGEHACAVNENRQRQSNPNNGKAKQDSSVPGTPSSSRGSKFRPYDPNKFCTHHSKAGHSTEECAEVKKQLAAKFAAGELKDVELHKKPPPEKKDGEGTSRPKRDRSPPKDTDSPPPPRTEKPMRRIDAVFRDLEIFDGLEEVDCAPPPAPKKKCSPCLCFPRICRGGNDAILPSINYIFGGSELCGTSINSVKASIRRVKSDLRAETSLEGPDTKISFWESETCDLDKPHDDALVIELQVAGCVLTKMLVDTGSSVDLIFFNTLRSMKVDLKEIKGERVVLYGFSGETALTMGTIELPVVAEGVKKMVKFMVVDKKAPFFAILGRPWIHAMRAVFSTYHQCIKFPTPRGIAAIRGSQNVSRICYMVGFHVIKESGE